MRYLSAKEIAEKWNIGRRRVLTLCEEGRIYNAQRIGNMWIIPEDTKKPVDGRHLRYDNFETKLVKPFVKWAGGKNQLLNDIRQSYPIALGKKIKKYAEPFVGGGAVLFDILSEYHLNSIYISDTNTELIITYKVVRDDVDSLIELLLNYQAEYIPLDTLKRKEYFYQKRQRFNKIKQNAGTYTKIELAALFIFLNKTCFNGLYRVNRKGEYNVPMGAYKNPLICDTDNLTNISKALEKVTIECADFRESRKFIDDKTLVYFDPPYRPLNKTSNFTSYTENEFNDTSQRELAEFVNEMSQRNAYIIVSNSDPKNSDEDDDFFDVLYKGHHIKRVEAIRAINSKGSSRGKIKELLITNY
jgi:DNA adenine methylase